MHSFTRHVVEPRASAVLRSMEGLSVTAPPDILTRGTPEERENSLKDTAFRGVQRAAEFNR